MILKIFMWKDVNVIRENNFDFAYVRKIYFENRNIFLKCIYAGFFMMTLKVFIIRFRINVFLCNVYAREKYFNKFYVLYKVGSMFQ